jgi:WD40 repeat protein
MKKIKKRNRGIILTPEGLHRIQEARFKSEQIDNSGQRYTLEKLSDLTELDIHTIKRVLACKQGVDQRTLERFFIAFNLELTETYYSKPNHDKRQSWGEATSVSKFYGRTEKITTLNQWLLIERCRLVVILGMGGVGKSSLSVKLAKQIQDNFDYVIWRTLQNSPPINQFLASLIRFLSEGQEVEANLPKSTNDRISLLIEYLRLSRCLLVLDNFESLLCGVSRAGVCREEYEEYSLLLKRIGQTEHQSCLLLTTREKPKEIATLEGEELPVRTLRLNGLKEKEGRKILIAKGLKGLEKELDTLVERYAGNPLALKVIATSIDELFGGNISEFLTQSTSIFGDIRDLLDQQFKRLSDIEKEIMYWLAINREPISLFELREDIVSPISTMSLMEGLESLSRRSLIEKNATRFTMQPVVMEYVTFSLIEKVCQELQTQELNFFRRYALIKATAKDYIREFQIRLILQPVIERLLTIFMGTKSVAKYLTEILSIQQKLSYSYTGYVAGNILNLLCKMRINFKGYDFSDLTVCQADLRNVCLHDVNFQNVNFIKSVFAETLGGIMSIAFSPNGEFFAVGDSNNDIRLYRVIDNQQIIVYKGHSNWVVSLAFSPDSLTLASGSCDHSVKLWDVSNGQCLHSLEKHNHEVWSVIFSSNGEVLASGSDDCTARLWDVSNGQCLSVFQGHTNYVLSVAFTNDDSTLISGSHDRTIRQWDIKTGECFKVLQGHSDEIRAIAVHPNSPILASSSNDCTVRLWNLKTGECFKVLQGHSDGVWSVAFNPQGNILASGSRDQTARLWNVQTGECQKTLEGHTNWVLSVAFNPQGNILASGSRDQTARLWNVQTGECQKTFQGRTNQILSVAFSPNGQLLASGGYDQKIRVWDTTNGQCQKTLEGHTNWVLSVAFNPQGNILASGSRDQTVKLWDICTDKVLKTFRGHCAAVRSVVFGHDSNNILASGSEDKTIRLWDICTGQTLRILKGHSAGIWSIAFSPDGQLLASGSLDGTVKLWNVSTGECQKTLEGHTSWVWSVAFSPDHKILASTSPDQTIKLWDLKTGECQKTLEGHISCSLSVAFSPDHKILASSSQDHKILLWDLKTGQCLKIFQGHAATIWSIAFSSDNLTLVSGSEDETIRLWNWKTGKNQKTLRAKKVYDGMQIRGIKGLTEGTIATLQALGGVN